jgi:hypothetical protein
VKFPLDENHAVTLPSDSQVSDIPLIVKPDDTDSPGLAYIVAADGENEQPANAIGDETNEPATTIASGAAFGAMLPSFWMR